MKKRQSRVERKTKETHITISLVIDGTGKSTIKSEIGFFNHMLELFTRHGLFNLGAEIKGDLHVDQHHTIEDVGITLGTAFKNALGEKRGIRRAGFFIHPMDEALVLVAVDICGRPFFKLDGTFRSKKIGDLSTEVLEDFFEGFANALGSTLHIRIFYGRSDHHKAEAIFKAFGKAMKHACEIEQRAKEEIPSTKGTL